MSSTLLTLTQRLVRRLALSTEPTLVVGSTDPGIKQIRELFQEEGDSLVKRHDWSGLITSWTITLSTSPNLTPFLADYERMNKDARLYRSGSKYTSLNGPIRADDWQYLVNVAGTYPGYWRIFGGYLQILGVSITETVSTEYISKNWILDTNGSTTKAEWAADTDTTRFFRDDLMLAGVRWRWRQMKGLEYAEDMETYERILEIAISEDRAATTISTANTMPQMLYPNTWPGTITL